MPSSLPTFLLPFLYPLPSNFDSSGVGPENFISNKSPGDCNEATIENSLLLRISSSLEICFICDALNCDNFGNSLQTVATHKRVEPRVSQRKVKVPKVTPPVHPYRHFICAYFFKSLEMMHLLFATENILPDVFLR